MNDGAAPAVPLCGVCEEVPAERNLLGGSLYDPDLGPVCYECGLCLCDALNVLRGTGLRECLNLGPGRARGGLGG